jgi:hypothetical protein
LGCGYDHSRLNDVKITTFEALLDRHQPEVKLELTRRSEAKPHGNKNKVSMSASYAIDQTATWSGWDALLFLAKAAQNRSTSAMAQWYFLS